MKPQTKRVVFPYYLTPGPDKSILRWFGKWLEAARKKRTLKTVAEAAGVSSQEVQAIERGVFKLSLGRLRDIVRRGYRVEFADLLAECYETFRADFDPLRKRPFKRDFHYTLSRRKEVGKRPTPLLMGGDTSSYLWGVPMRSLKDQPIVTELLELAPYRKRKPPGRTMENIHDGVEVIHVIHGNVEAHIATGEGEAQTTRRLKGGDCIHFHATCTHYLENIEKNTSALLLIVRLSQL